MKRPLMVDIIKTKIKTKKSKLCNDSVLQPNKEKLAIE